MSILELAKEEGGIINEARRLPQGTSKATNVSSKVTLAPSNDTGFDANFHFDSIGEKTLMVTIVVLSILLSINIALTHGNAVVRFYQCLYKKLKKPKFKSGELVFIGDIEYEIILIAKGYRPYTYFCLPINIKSSRMLEGYYHESEIRKKTGLLKELE